MTRATLNHRPPPSAASSGTPRVEAPPNVGTPPSPSNSSGRRRTSVLVNAGANVLRCGVAIGVMFLLTPHIIRTLGADRYGLWMLVGALVGYLELLDLGFATATVRFVGACGRPEDVEPRNRLVSTLLLAYLVLGGVVLLAAHWVGATWAAGLPVDDARLFGWVFALLAWKSATSLPMSLFQGLLFGQQRICLVSVVRATWSLLFGVGACWALSAGHGLAGLAWATCLTAWGEQLSLLAVCWRVTPGLRIGLRRIDAKLLRDVMGFSLFALVTNLSTAALLRTDPILIQWYLPLSAVAVYALALKIAEQLLLLTKQAVNAFSPLLAELGGAGNEREIRQVWLDSTRMSLLAMLTFAGPIVGWAPELLTLWVGEEFRGAAPLLAVLGAALLIRIVHECGANVLAMTGRHRLVAMVALASAVLNVGLSLAFLPVWGLAGVAWGTFVATALTAVPLLSIVCRERALAGREFLLGTIWPAMRSAVALGAWIAALRCLVVPSNWLELFLLLAICAVVPPLAHWSLARRATARDQRAGEARRWNTLEIRLHARQGDCCEGDVR